MNTAICTIDNQVYQSHTFSEIVDFETKKHRLVCPSCRGKAFFRGATRNGKVACFGARHILDQCTLFDQNHPQQQAPVVPTTEHETQVQVGGLLPEIDTDELQLLIMRPMPYRISEVLTLLEGDELFCGEDNNVEVPDHGNSTIRDLFVNLADVTDGHIGQYHGYWGKVQYTQPDRNETLWFNTGRDFPSVLLDRQYRDDVFLRFNIGQLNDIVDAHILVFGVMNVSAAGKKYVQITDPNRFTLRMAR
jgi:hypothetical protein